MTKEKEIWVPICEKYTTCSCNDYGTIDTYNIKPIYEISNLGRIRNKNTKKIISVRPDGNVTLSVICGMINGYKYENRYGMRVARLWHLTFKGPLEHNQRVKFVYYLDTEII